MFCPDVFSKPAAKASLLISAIAGSVLAASVLTAPPSVASSAMQLDSPPTNAEPSDVNPGAIAISVGGSVALCLGVNAIVDRQHPPSARRSAANPLLQSSQGVSFNRASRSLQRQMLLLLPNDQSAAHRLFTQTSLRHPGETPNWYAEKVIYDLERDRGAR
jgi:hypothetical protein